MKYDQVDIEAINDLTDTKTLAHLLKYDSLHGRYPGEVSHTDSSIIVDGHEIKVYSERDPAQLPWGEHGIDVVLESTGIFRSPDTAGKHLEAGARKVVISAPAKGDVKTVVLGVNDGELSAEDAIVSNASCTTNCLAPMAMVLDREFGIENGFMTTIHAYTADQRIQDAPHSDLRRARAAAVSMIPTTTGAAKAVSLVLPQLKGKLDGAAVRVPTPTGSMTELCVNLSKEVDAETVNQAMKKAAENELKGIMEYTEDPLVSADIVSNPYSCIFDSGLTIVSGGLLRVVGWYDNEAGYSARAAEMVVRLGS
jgi:glyceraldehyde 3-phosphate dehydrogenase